MLSSDKNIENIAQLIEALKKYVELQKEYMKFDVTALTLCTVVFVLVIAVLFYLSFAVVYWIEPFVGTAGGYAVVAGFFLLVLIIVLAKRKTWIEQPLIRLLANILLN